jgi:hypothetical protein
VVGVAPIIKSLAVGQKNPDDGCVTLTANEVIGPLEITPKNVLVVVFVSDCMSVWVPSTAVMFTVTPARNAPKTSLPKNYPPTPRTLLLVGL